MSWANKAQNNTYSDQKTVSSFRLDSFPFPFSFS